MHWKLDWKTLEVDCKILHLGFKLQWFSFGFLVLVNDPLFHKRKTTSLIISPVCAILQLLNSNQKPFNLSFAM